ncbi:MAG: hypothetical protein HXX08_11275 [Chloroflexi bacterium]|uniref:Uncharacterized protein n=1 Tax=Candidatus Chlorohelix allophototropha TaxID=3003348 RepID=A0A8T7M2G2_9CHLR|nr:hypothetical protein [Chloroflexota bacterium]WJW65818.1 hypothetical protein OZ401_001597 [Chloroflexota bacterium L227-S17]
MDTSNNADRRLTGKIRSFAKDGFLTLELVNTVQLHYDKMQLPKEGDVVDTVLDGKPARVKIVWINSGYIGMELQDG